MTASSLEQISSLAKRRGFIFQSSEIYGGAANSYDYGPLGVELKNNIRKAWWREMVRQHDNIVGLDSAIFMHPRVWEASGHVENFTDPLVECKECHKRFRTDQLIGEEDYRGLKGEPEEINKRLTELNCPACGAKGQFTESRQFNTMFATNLGTVEGEGTKVFLRPETAQGIYVDALLVAKTMRLDIPFGIAQIGKAFRNEITPSNYTFRTIEFEQMEMQYFVREENAQKEFATWKEKRFEWYQRLGFAENELRLHPRGKDELAHYAKEAVDVEFKMPFGWKEIEGIHNRGDWDLSRHSEYSGRDLSFYDEKKGEKFIPWVVETSAGLDRITLALLASVYQEEEQKGEKRTVLRFPPHLAPVQVAVFPLLSNNEKLTGKGREISDSLRGDFLLQYDEGGSIGRRYRRQDEIGTPYCVTIDHDSLEQNDATVRDRDTMKQERVAIPELQDYLADKLKKPHDKRIITQS